MLRFPSVLRRLLEQLTTLNSPIDQHGRATIGVFITGTDTDVGKTYFTSWLARKLRTSGARVGCYKPVCSGGLCSEAGEWRWHDVETLYEALEGEFPRELICPTRLQAPLAPPLAAQAESVVLSLETMLRGVENWMRRVDILLVEGVGGWLCPLTATETVADFAAALGWPVLLVAPQRLGMLNHTLLTLESIQRRLSVRGVVINEISAESDDSAQYNEVELQKWTPVPVLGVLPHGAGDSLIDLQHRGQPCTIDWWQLLR